MSVVIAALCGGFVGGLLWHLLERWDAKRRMPYVWKCPVPGCSFTTRASHTSAIQTMRAVHEKGLVHK